MRMGWTDVKNNEPDPTQFRISEHYHVEFKRWAFPDYQQHDCSSTNWALTPTQFLLLIQYGRKELYEPVLRYHRWYAPKAKIKLLRWTFIMGRGTSSPYNIVADAAEDWRQYPSEPPTVCSSSQ